MPVWLRRFTFNKMREYYDKQNASQNEDLATQSKKIKEGKIDLPSHFKGHMDKGKKLAKY